MKKAKWIWVDTPEQSDEYVTFYDTVEYVSGKVTMDISVSGDYLVYINGEVVAFGQYSDYPNYKIYDSVDITPWLKKGRNEIKIIGYYVGTDFFTNVKMSRGLLYEIYSENDILSYSQKGLRCSLNQNYISHENKIITTQLGYSYLYDTRNKDSSCFLSAVEVVGFDNLTLRQNKKTVLGDYVLGKECNTDKMIYDLGKECCGFLKIKFQAQAGAMVRVAFGEHLIDGKVRDKIGGRDFSVALIGNGEHVSFTGVFRRLGCRYLQIHSDCDVEVEEIGIQEVQYPFTIKPYEIDGELRKKIYETSVRTLQLCAHEHYEDCPWREQAMYIQDSRNQMLCGHCAFDNAEFARSSILLMLNGQREDGLFEICFPANNEFTIPSFSLSFPVIVLEYTQATRNTEIAEKSFASIEKMLAFFLTRLQENGLFKTVSDKTLWHFYEWAGDLDGNFFSEDENEKARNDYDVLINAFLSWACGKMVEICNVLGEFERANYYRATIESINNAINLVFFDAENTIYKTYEGGVSYSQLANALCVLCGACPSEYVQAVAEKIAYGYDGWVENTLSMNIFRFDALLKADKEKYSEFILQEIDSIYGKMLEFGATSFWETEKGASDFDGAGSLCHGWSAIPIYYYHILGVVKNGRETLSNAFALRDNKARYNYKESLSRYIKRREDMLFQAHSKDIYLPESEKREKLKRLLGEPLVGDFDDTVRLLEKELVIQTSKIKVERYTFRVLDEIDFFGFAYSLVDDDTDKKALVYCLHGGGGTPEIVGELFHPSENYNRMANRLLRKGNIVFAPQLWLWREDWYGVMGNRTVSNRRLIQQGGSITALELFCLMRSLDWFEKQSFVDSERIGVAGLSYGGMYALHFAALDTRIKTTISDCWFNDRRVHNWHDWTYFGAEKGMMDAEVASLVLPRKLYIEIGDKDETFCVDTALRERDKLLEYAEKTGYNENLSFVIFDGTHEFNTNNKTVELFLRDLQEV